MIDQKRLDEIDANIMASSISRPLVPLQDAKDLRAAVEELQKENKLLSGAIGTYKAIHDMGEGLIQENTTLKARVGELEDCIRDLMPFLEEDKGLGIVTSYREAIEACEAALGREGVGG